MARTSNLNEELGQVGIQEEMSSRYWQQLYVDTLPCSETSVDPLIRKSKVSTVLEKPVKVFERRKSILAGKVLKDEWSGGALKFLD